MTLILKCVPGSIRFNAATLAAVQRAAFRAASQTALNVKNTEKNAGRIPETRRHRDRLSLCVCVRARACGSVCGCVCVCMYARKTVRICGGGELGDHTLCALTPPTPTHTHGTQQHFALKNIKLGKRKALVSGFM